MTTAARLILLVLLPAWTYLLLTPKPVPDEVVESLSLFDSAIFLIAKSVHVGVYATLAALGVVALGRKYAPVVAVALVLHGATTEYGQTHVANRGGSVRDVLLDALGVSIGIAVARRLVP